MQFLRLLVVCLIAKDMIDGRRIAYCHDVPLDVCKEVLENIRNHPTARDFRLERCVRKEDLPDNVQIEDSSGQVVPTTS